MKPLHILRLAAATLLFAACQSDSFKIKGTAEVKIYDGALEINLDEFAEIIERGY